MQRDQLSWGDTYLYLSGAAKYHDVWLVKMLFFFFSNFYVSVYECFVWVPQVCCACGDQESRAGFPGTGLPRECWESSPGPMQEHPVL